MSSFACVPDCDSNGGLVFGFHLRDGCELDGFLTRLVAHWCIYLFNDGSVRQIDLQQHIVVHSGARIDYLDDVGCFSVGFDRVVVVLDREGEFALAFHSHGFLYRFGTNRLGIGLHAQDEVPFLDRQECELGSDGLA